jgi:hypothetical protein
MRARGISLLLFLCVSTAPAAELHTLKGEVLKGDVQGINDKEIVLAVGGKRVATPLPQVLKIDFSAKKERLEEKYSDVELNDGTLLHCKDVAIKGKQIKLQTLAGQELDLPLSAVANVLFPAHEEKYRKEWSERVAKKHRQDVVCINKSGTVNPLPGTIGEGDESGTKIAFTTARGLSGSLPLSNVHGLIFFRELDPNAPPVLCKLYDSFGDVVMVSAATTTPKGLSVTTPAGAKIEYALDALTRLDYTQDKVTFLSHATPVKVIETSNMEHIEHYRRDVNLDGRPLRVWGKEYPLGLALHAHTELEFDLKGDYREFKAVVGIDETVGGIDGPVVLEIEGDGKTLFRQTYTRKMKFENEEQKKKMTEPTLNIKDVQRLRIIVKSGELLDLGKHLDLANAKVSK